MWELAQKPVYPAETNLNQSGILISIPVKNQLSSLYASIALYPDLIRENKWLAKYKYTNLTPSG